MNNERSSLKVYKVNLMKIPKKIILIFTVTEAGNSPHEKKSWMNSQKRLKKKGESHSTTLTSEYHWVNEN